MIKKKHAVLLIFFMFFSLSGCATRNAKEYFVRPGLNLGYIRVVAVLPFENSAGDAVTAAACRQITINQILSSGLFDVVEKMQVDSMLRREAINPSAPIDAPSLRRLGNLLGVQGFIVGSLNQTGQQQRGSSVFSEISLNLRLIDSESGLVLWHANGRESGYSIWNRLFGVGVKDSYQLTSELIRKMLRTIGERPGEKA
jgi:TolB-like protein